MEGGHVGVWAGSPSRSRNQGSGSPPRPSSEALPPVSLPFLRQSDVSSKRWRSTGSEGCICCVVLALAPGYFRSQGHPLYSQLDTRGTGSLLVSWLTAFQQECTRTGLGCGLVSWQLRLSDSGVRSSGRWVPPTPGPCAQPGPSLSLWGPGVELMTVCWEVTVPHTLRGPRSVTLLSFT